MAASMAGEFMARTPDLELRRQKSEGMAVHFACTNKAWIGFVPPLLSPLFLWVELHGSMVHDFHSSVVSVSVEFSIYFDVKPEKESGHKRQEHMDVESLNRYV
jgi:hypothetical protein